MIRISPINDTCNNNSPIELYGDIPEHNVVRMKPSRPTEEKNLPACNTLSLNSKSRQEKKFCVFRILTSASLKSCSATTSGLTIFDDCDMSFVSSGFDSSSIAKPGVSVSGGKHRVTEILYGRNSIAMLSARPRRANFVLQ